MDALTAIELRVLGCLLEKSVTTPDQYPMTLNAIITGSNQKSSRDPVMNLSQGEVQRALRLLEDKLLVSNDPNMRGRVEKYLQRFCKQPFGVYEFSPAQYAVLTVLMLRGPQTPGELRTRADRLHKFADNEAVTATLISLRDWESGLVVELLREANRRDACWAQLFGEDADQFRAQGSDTAPATPTPAVAQSVPDEHLQESVTASAQEAVRPDAVKPETIAAKTGNGLERLAALEARVQQLEAQLAQLQEALGE